MYKVVIYDVCPIVPTIGLHSNQASEDIQLIMEIQKNSYAKILFKNL